MIIFAGVLGVLIMYYVYTYVKHKRRSKKHIDSVNEFKRKYQKNKLQKKADDLEGYTKYLTKYNSSVDYIEKEDFLKEAAELNEKEKPKDWFA